MPKSQFTPTNFAGARATSADARALAWPDNTATDHTATLVCLSCGDTMGHQRTIPKLDRHKELLVLVCPSCKHVEIMADNRGGIRPARPPVAPAN